MEPVDNKQSFNKKAVKTNLLCVSIEYFLE
nr:MAG TPA: hypothetical protein [Caudoviricetes sp.]